MINQQANSISLEPSETHNNFKVIIISIFFLRNDHVLDEMQHC